MCTNAREVLGSGKFVGFGASELISAGLKHGIIDCAVIASDGAGTVIVRSPELVQGIGGRMSGLVKTSPLLGIIKRLKTQVELSSTKKTARIDQPTGTARMVY